MVFLTFMRVPLLPARVRVALLMGHWWVTYCPAATLNDLPEMDSTAEPCDAPVSR